MCEVSNDRQKITPFQIFGKFIVFFGHGNSTSASIFLKCFRRNFILKPVYLFCLKKVYLKIEIPFLFRNIIETDHLLLYSDVTYKSVKTKRILLISNVKRIL